MPSLSNDFGTLRANQYQVKDLLYNNIEIVPQFYLAIDDHRSLL
jgi:hypothetical protein